MPRKKRAVKEEEDEDVVQIQSPNYKVMEIPIIGLSPYIPHRLSSESMQTIEDKVTGNARGKNKKVRNFDEEYERCFYRDEDGDYAIPGVAFKRAITDEGANQYSLGNKDISKKMIARNIHILGSFCKLKYDKVRRRVDYPRQGGATGAPDIRHRPEFIGWKTKITVRYDADNFTKEAILNLIQRAGMTIGVGDWRPGSPKSPGGSYGMWEIGKTNKE